MHSAPDEVGPTLQSKYIYLLFKTTKLFFSGIFLTLMSDNNNKKLNFYNFSHYKFIRLFLLLLFYFLNKGRVKSYNHWISFLLRHLCFDVVSSFNYKGLLHLLQRAPRTASSALCSWRWRFLWTWTRRHRRRRPAHALGVNVCVASRALFYVYVHDARAKWWDPNKENRMRPLQLCVSTRLACVVPGFFSPPPNHSGVTPPPPPRPQRGCLINDVISAMVPHHTALEVYAWRRKARGHGVGGFPPPLCLVLSEKKSIKATIGNRRRYLHLARRRSRR